MRIVDILSGAAFIALSLAVLPESLGLQFYSEGVPGPGFFPTLLAITIAVSGALLIASRVGKREEVFPEFERVGAENSKWDVRPGIPRMDWVWGGVQRERRSLRRL